MKKKRLWFSFDIDEALRQAGYRTNQRFGKMEFYEVSSGFADKANQPKPEEPRIMPDETGRLRLE